MLEEEGAEMMPQSLSPVPRNPCPYGSQDSPSPLLSSPLMNPTCIHTFPALASAHAIPSPEPFFAPLSTLYVPGPVLSDSPWLSHFVLMMPPDRYTLISQERKPQPSDNEQQARALRHRAVSSGEGQLLKGRDLPSVLLHCMNTYVSLPS